VAHNFGGALVANLALLGVTLFHDWGGVCGWSWHGVFLTMILCCVLTMLFSALTLGHQTVSETRSPEVDSPKL